LTSVQLRSSTSSSALSAAMPMLACRRHRRAAGVCGRAERGGQATAGWVGSQDNRRPERSHQHLLGRCVALQAQEQHVSGVHPCPLSYGDGRHPSGHRSARAPVSSPAYVLAALRLPVQKDGTRAAGDLASHPRPSLRSSTLSRPCPATRGRPRWDAGLLARTLPVARSGCSRELGLDGVARAIPVRAPV
jgi:hypothetical protein